ncbi:MAG: cobalamin transport system permease protein [Acidobacteriota bacterium]|jgi:iron complex transport system permease protein|nr:cobalamin transport system permease protein [Acidobacteriota bacterium]
MRPHPRAALLVLLLLWGAVVIGAPLVGSQPISLGDVLRGDPTAGAIFWQLRLPRVLLALIAGAGLAVSGLAFQTLFRNELAEPYTLGIATGAALGAVLSLRLEEMGVLWGMPLVSLASFVGAIGATALVVGLAWRRKGNTGTLLLAGIAVSLSCSALILFLQYLSDSTQTFRMVRWMMGGLSVVGYGEVLWAAPWVLGGAAVLLALRWDLNLLLTGEELAASRGVDLVRLRLQVLGVSALMIGALVAVAGPIGFVGLMVPHMLRRWVGHDHLFLAPACLLGGGAFLAVCDLAARTIMSPAELPVGVLTALLGGPFFLWLLVLGRKD